MDVTTLFSVDGKTALVTGGSRGIGAMIAEAMVRSGAKVYVASRDADACRRTADRLAEFGWCEPLPADLSTEEGCRALAAELSRRETALDILVNNAGTAWGAALEQYPVAGFDKVMNLNVRATFVLTQSLLGLL
ncbi:MAG: SDR family NAD(P)-dependent oxidoreductase, partial [Nitriliruptoraceae bacterium]